MPENKPYFRPALFAFLRDLRENNDRDWFNANKDRYIRNVLEPAQRFISDFGPRLKKISPNFNADPRPSGGSIFRIYRDVRFSRDKSPYKTHLGIQFRHKQAKDAHAPGFYLHLEPGQIFCGAGMWHPDGKTLTAIRQAIDANGTRFKRVAHGGRFREFYEPAGDSLKRPPRGFDAEHPMIEDLKRKDFFGLAKLTQSAATSADFMDRYTETSKAATAYVRFLCEAVGVPF